MEKRFWTEICMTIRVITGDYCSKSDSKEEVRGSGTVVCVARRRNDSESHRLSTERSKTQLPWFRNSCDKHHYHCSSFSFVWKSRCLYLFCIVCYCFSWNNFLKFMLRCCIMNHPRCGDCAFSASFVKECTDVSYVVGEGVGLTVHKETLGAFQFRNSPNVQENIMYNKSKHCSSAKDWWRAENERTFKRHVSIPYLQPSR